ncbi:MAG: hypothetical protein Q8Q36_00720 [bacterium]|nr:hypothetical protein [bacterium]
MQIRLAERHNEDLDDFIAEHAAEFRKTVGEHPELIEKFEEDPEKALGELDHYLYH